MNFLRAEEIEILSSWTKCLRGNEGERRKEKGLMRMLFEAVDQFSNEKNGAHSQRDGEYERQDFKSHRSRLHFGAFVQEQKQKL